MRALLWAGILLLALQTSALAAPVPVPDCATRPPWCQPGYVCLPTTCAADTTAQLFLLTAERDSFADRLKVAKGRRLHFDLTCGASLVAELERNELSTPAGPGCTAGLAIRLW